MIKLNQKLLKKEVKLRQVQGELKRKENKLRYQSRTPKEKKLIDRERARTEHLTEQVIISYFYFLD